MFNYFNVIDLISMGFIFTFTLPFIIHFLVSKIIV